MSEQEGQAPTNYIEEQIKGYKYNKFQRKEEKLEKKLKTTLTTIIQIRLASKGSGYGDDLLGAMLEACFVTEHGEKRDELTLTMDEIIDECKTFFFAGHETTSHLLTWTMFLLSVYPEWQERLREEVFRECGNANPTADMLNKLKEVSWIPYPLLAIVVLIILMPFLLYKCDHNICLQSLVVGL